MSAASLTKISSFCGSMSLHVCHGLLWPGHMRWLSVPASSVSEQAHAQHREPERLDAVLSKLQPPQGHPWGGGRWHRLSASGILGPFEVPV